MPCAAAASVLPAARSRDGSRRGDGFEDLKPFEPEFGGEFIELGDLGLGEMEAAGLVGTLAGLGLELAGKDAALVAVAENVLDDGREIPRLIASCGDIASGDG